MKRKMNTTLIRHHFTLFLMKVTITELNVLQYQKYYEVLKSHTERQNANSLVHKIHAYRIHPTQRNLSNSANGQC
jgi:hypothetical protein